MYGTKAERGSFQTAPGEHRSKLRWRQWRLEVIKPVKHLNESNLSHGEGPRPRISQAAAHGLLCLRTTYAAALVRPAGRWRSAGALQSRSSHRQHAFLARRLSAGNRLARAATAPCSRNAGQVLSEAKHPVFSHYAACPNARHFTLLGKPASLGQQLGKKKVFYS